MAHLKRRAFFNTSFWGITSLGLWPFFNKTENQIMKKSKPIKGDLIHCVFFWLKTPEDTVARELFMKELTSFIDEMDMIVGRHIGYPAPTDRDVIDNTYTYSLILTFKDKADQDAYQDHPRHKQFVEIASDLWQKVQVYDTIML